VDAGVTFGATAGNLGTGDFTIAFAIATTTEGPIAEVMSKRSICNVSPFWDVRSTAQGHLFFELYGPNSDTGAATVVPVNDGAFHTVVFTRTGISTAAYVEGRLVSRREYAATAGVVNDAPMGASIGPCIGADGTVVFTGTLDEIRLADSAEPYLLLPEFECGDAALNGGVNATDALAALRTSVGTAECPLCVGDVNGSSAMTAVDALMILGFAVGQPIELSCPACEF
jgi:hypothetical protein